MIGVYPFFFLSFFSLGPLGSDSLKIGNRLDVLVVRVNRLQQITP
jgi:hypothetical protein